MAEEETIPVMSDLHHGVIQEIEGDPAGSKRDIDDLPIVYSFVPEWLTVRAFCLARNLLMNSTSGQNVLT